MRGTLHFVAAADVRWMLELLTPRVIANAAARAVRLELDDKTLLRCEKIFVRELSGNRQLTREALMAELERNKIPTINNRSYHILWRLAQEGVICFGARSGKQHTFALLDEWITPAKKLERDAALVELARRYFTSHGPATLKDFTGWSGLKSVDARAGIEGAASELERETIDGTVYWSSRNSGKETQHSSEGFLLPGFDEFLLGYKDRDAVLDRQHAQKIVPGSNGMFLPTLIIDGRVAGVWKRAVKKKAIVIAANCFKPIKNSEKQRFAIATARYAKFLGLPVEIAWPR
jgi:hypothetical protein